MDGIAVPVCIQKGIPVAVPFPPLPFPMDALEPQISLATVENHYGRHHKTYVDRLNGLLVGQTEYAECDLEEIIHKAREESAQSILNLAGQVWNHNFYWECLRPHKALDPPPALSGVLADQFGSFQGFQQAFEEKAGKLFGSGWVWLVSDTSGNLSIETTPNGETFAGMPQKPLLVLDVWEHAYYLDYQAGRAQYVSAWWHLVDWKGLQSRRLLAQD